MDGDGTVPAESAAVSYLLSFVRSSSLLCLDLSPHFYFYSQAAQFKSVASVGVSGTHRGLLHDKRVFELIQQWLGVEPKKAKRKHSRTHKVADSG